MYNNKKVSLVFPVYNEEENIKIAINEFDSLKIFDEIISVDNNSSDKTARFIKETNSIYITETKQGYGAAIRKGINSSNGDLIVICEPDGSFDYKDTIKLLNLSDNYDCVFGTRTSKEFIEKGAKMYFLLRLGNIIVARFLSFLFPHNKFTDVGCTFKVLSKKSYKLIENKLTVSGSELQPEIMINLVLQKLSIVETPVTYKERKGKSKITKNFFATAFLALKMINLIIFLRIKSLVNFKF